MQGAGPSAPFGVPDRVGPGGYVGEVIGGVVAQEGVEVGRGGVGDEVAGEVGDGDVSEAWCCWAVCVSGGSVPAIVRLYGGERERKENWLFSVPPHAEAPPAKKAEVPIVTDDSFMVVSFVLLLDRRR